jgi:SAM-dependent methyltransferase
LVGEIASAPPAGFAASRRDHLWQLEQGHFWFASRDRLAGRLLRRLRRRTDAALIELGCGTGRLLASLDLEGLEVLGVEGYAESLERAAARGVTATLLQADVGALPVADAQFDLVLAFDVLEHVPSERFLREARRVARAGGRLLLSVPASPRLWSAHDAQAGHRCRYTVRQLRRELRDAGWIPSRHTHYQFILYPAVWASRMRATGVNALERRPPRWLDRLLSAINRLEVAALSGVTLPWGSSLFMSAEKGP